MSDAEKKGDFAIMRCMYCGEQIAGATGLKRVCMRCSNAQRPPENKGRDLRIALPPSGQIVRN